MTELNEAADHFRAKLAHETDAWDLRAMLRERHDVIVIDTRSEAAYAEQHIPQRLVSARENDCGHDEKLGSQCTLHYVLRWHWLQRLDKGALMLAELGFNVKELIGGIEW
jgi:rhodanese-related sulfurtransferase